MEHVDVLDVESCRVSRRMSDVLEVRDWTTI